MSLLLRRRCCYCVVVVVVASLLLSEQHYSFLDQVDVGKKEELLVLGGDLKRFQGKAIDARALLWRCLQVHTPHITTPIHSLLIRQHILSLSPPLSPHLHPYPPPEQSRGHWTQLHPKLCLRMKRKMAIAGKDTLTAHHPDAHSGGGSKPTSKTPVYSRTAGGVESATARRVLSRLQAFADIEHAPPDEVTAGDTTGGGFHQVIPLSAPTRFPPPPPHTCTLLPFPPR